MRKKGGRPGKRYEKADAEKNTKEPTPNFHPGFSQELEGNPDKTYPFPS